MITIYSKKTVALCMLALIAISCNSKQKTLMAEAEKLQRSILTIDTHTDTPMRLWNENYDINADNPTGCVDFPKMRKGSLDIETFAAFSGQGSRDTATTNKVYDRALKTIQKIHEATQKHSDVSSVVTTPAEMIQAKEQGKIGILVSIENGYPIGTDISRVRTLYKNGVRMFGLCHSYHNDICDSSSDKLPAEHRGLSAFGEAYVKELNRIGGLIDVSHASDSTFFDVVKISKTPIIASHSSIRSVADHNRNFSDEMLDALKANGGVIQICILDSYVKNFPKDSVYNLERALITEELLAINRGDKQLRDSIRKKYDVLKAKYPEQNAYIKDYVNHIDYVVKKIGVDYVGIGTDFDGGGGIADCKDASQLIGITAELMTRGYSKEDIAKIWGGNFLRVFDEVIKYSDSQKCD